MKNNIHFWLLEADDPTGQMPPQQPQMPQEPQGQPQMPPGEEQPPQAPPEEEQPDDVTQDPQNIEEPQQEAQSFEEWRHDFMEMAIKGDNEELVNMLNSIRDNELEVSQSRFVEDNVQVFMFRRDHNVLEASKKFKSLLKQDLDRTNPGTTVMQHLSQVLETDPTLYQGLIKLSGTFAWKADLHRKWIAALLGAVQVGGGSVTKDIQICEKKYDINLSTRFATQWGEINIGKWSLIESDPKEHLKPDEQEGMEEGSPEEKQMYRRKIIIKSIGETYRKRAFIVHVVGMDGTIYSLGWDLGNSVLDAYKAGKLVVRGRENADKEIMIGDDGEIIPVIDYSIMFLKETGEVDDSGRPETEEVPFMERRDSTLYLVADAELLKLASSTMSGMFFHSVPYGGNPSDILKLRRSIPGLYELISKQTV